MCEREIFSFLGDLMYKLWSRLLPGFDWLFCVLFLHRWLVLRLHRVISRNRSLRCRIVLFFFVDRVLKMSGGNLCCSIFNFKLFKLSGGNFPSINWFNRMLFMYRWLVLRQHRIDSRDRILCFRVLHVVFSIGLFKLPCWKIFFGAFFDQLLKLYRWNLHCFSIEHKLHELLHWFLSGLDRLDSLFGLRCRFLLRNDWSFGCNREMCEREIFSFFGDLMYKL